MTAKKLPTLAWNYWSAKELQALRPALVGRANGVREAMSACGRSESSVREKAVQILRSVALIHGKLKPDDIPSVKRRRTAILLAGIAAGDSDAAIALRAKVPKSSVAQSRAVMHATVEFIRAASSDPEVACEAADEILREKKDVRNLKQQWAEWEMELLYPLAVAGVLRAPTDVVTRLNRTERAICAMLRLMVRAVDAAKAGAPFTTPPGMAHVNAARIHALAKSVAAKSAEAPKQQATTVPVSAAKWVLATDGLAMALSADPAGMVRVVSAGFEATYQKTQLGVFDSAEKAAQEVEAYAATYDKRLQLQAFAVNCTGAPPRLCGVRLVGPIADPVIRYTESGKPVMSVALCGERGAWHRVVFWPTGTSDLEAAKRLKKGDVVFVTGTIDYRQWKTSQGETRVTTEIVATHVLRVCAGEVEP